MPYRAWFRCIAGCPGDASARRADLSLPDLRRSARGRARPRRAARRARRRRGCELFDDRYKRTTWPYGSACGARRSGSRPRVRDEHDRVDGRGRHQPASGPSASAASSASPICGSSSAATRTPASFKDLGMTVLVSTVRADDRRRQADPRRRLRVDRRHLGVARRLLRRRRHPRRSCSCRAARSRRRSWCSRSPTARWCWRSTPTSTAAWRSCSSSPPRSGVYLANSMNSLRARGPEDGRRSRSCSSSTGRCPTGSSSPAATSATSARSAPAST